MITAGYHFFSAIAFSGILALPASGQVTRYNNTSVDWSGVGADGGVAVLAWTLGIGDAVPGMGSSFTTTLSIGDWDNAGMEWTSVTFNQSQIGYSGGPANSLTSSEIFWGALPATPGYEMSSTNIAVPVSELNFGTGDETAIVNQTGGPFPRIRR